MSKFMSLIEKISGLLSMIAGVTILISGALTVADVISRTTGNGSILGVYEITTLTLVGIAFLGLSRAELSGTHVSVDLVEASRSSRTRKIFSIIRLAIITVLAVLLLYGMLGETFSAFERNDTTNDLLRLHTWPAKAVIFISFGLFFISAIGKEIGFLTNTTTHTAKEDVS